MASQLKVEANQSNALRSTRPRPLKGKEGSLLHALKHGLTSDRMRCATSHLYPRSSVDFFTRNRRGSFQEGDRMGWERRGSGGQLYFYVKKRIGGRVTSLYVGSGLLAELSAAEIVRNREVRERQREVMRSLREEHADQDQAVRELDHLTKALVRAVLLAQGFHEHKGQWRRRKR